MKARLMALTGLLTTLSACAAPPTASQNEHPVVAPVQPLMPQPSSRMPPAQSRISGEYIVTVQEESSDDAASAVIRAVFAAQDIRSIKPLDQGHYLLIIGDDPGPNAMASLAGKSPQELQIQPNMIYRNPAPSGQGIKLRN